MAAPQCAAFFFMTTVQTLRTAGIRAQIAKRGITLQVQPVTGASASYSALLDTQPLKDGEFALAKEERTTDTVCILRVDLGAVVIAVGNVFEDAESGATYRVTAVIDKPVDVLLRFVCETTI